jgi:hypothetical protein
MKNTLLSFGIIGLTGVLLSSFALMQKGDEPQGPKKTRHIKMVKIENGKKMEIDTVLAGDDVFVWNGDTINQVKHIKKFNHADFDKMHQFDVKVDSKDGNDDVMIIKHKGGRKGEPAIWHMSPSDDMEVITEDIDSIGKKIVVRKRMKDGHGNNMIYFNDEEMKHFPPMPPMPPVPPIPPVPHMKMMGIQHFGQTIDLNDPNIISFKKKEMSGDREKIEIIRKKSDDNANSTFNFRFDNGELMAPEAPEAPEFNWKSDGDSLRTKIIEKKKVIKGKDGKEIDVKIESEENK